MIRSFYWMVIIFNIVRVEDMIIGPIISNLTIFAITEEYAPNWSSVILATVLMVVGVNVLYWSRIRLRGATLTPANCWAMLSVILVGASIVITGLFPNGEAIWNAPLQFAVAATTFCPCISVLGSRRPQTGVWQLVVLSLWAIVALPAAEALIIHPGVSLDVGGLRGWFLMSLIIMGVANWLPTRFWFSAILFAAGQGVLLIEHLPLSNGLVVPGGDMTGLGLCVAALTLAALGLPRRSYSPAPLDRVWLDFRDGFGALWAARVAERINVASTNSGWKTTLTWSGFRSDEGSLKQGVLPEMIPVVQQSLENTLRRFVTAEWIGSRMGGSVD